MIKELKTEQWICLIVVSSFPFVNLVVLLRILNSKTTINIKNFIKAYIIVFYTTVIIFLLKDEILQWLN